MLSSTLLEILVCPKSKQSLIYFPRGESDRDETDGFLLCPESQLRYPIRDGLPLMLVEQAEPLLPTTVASLVSRACELGLAAS